MERRSGSAGLLFLLLPRLVDLILKVGVERILWETAFQAERAHELLENITRVDWDRTPGFVWHHGSVDTAESFLEDFLATEVPTGEVQTPSRFLFPSPGP